MSAFERPVVSTLYADDDRGYLLYYTFDDTISVIMLKVQQRCRRQGVATTLLKQLLRFADERLMVIHLSAVTMDDITGMLQDDLVAFYLKHGFEQREGKTPNNLLRIPRQVD
jgi:ribosomal protein S18 acetylase RimI-like enzyme